MAVRPADGDEARADDVSPVTRCQRVTSAFPQSRSNPDDRRRFGPSTCSIRLIAATRTSRSRCEEHTPQTTVMTPDRHYSYRVS